MRGESPDPPAGNGRDVLREDTRRNRGRGARRIHTSYSNREMLVDLLTAYALPLSIGGFLLACILVGLAATGNLPSITVPPWVWAALFWVLVGALASAFPAFLLYRYFHDPDGVEILDLDPVTQDHRHLRVGHEKWDEMRVFSPWGSEVGTESLQEATVNGLTGFEVMDLRVHKDGTPTCVATWMGEADAATLRTYKSAVTVARRRLAKQAEKATVMEANQQTIVREAAEKVVVELIRTSERSGMPNGDEIEGVVEGVMRDYGLEDPLTDDDLDHDADGVSLSTDDPDDGDPRDARDGERQLGEAQRRSNGYAKSNGHAAPEGSQ